MGWRIMPFRVAREARRHSSWPRLCGRPTTITRARPDSPALRSHMPRHACASHLLAQGLSLKEIGDHLGHESPQTTRIYAKVDLNALRTVGDFELEGLL